MSITLLEDHEATKKRKANWDYAKQEHSGKIKWELNKVEYFLTKLILNRKRMLKYAKNLYQ